MTHDEVPERRRHRRVIAPATNANPEDTPDFTEPHGDLDEQGSGADGPSQEVGTDQWWRAQRPPHWG